jgi:hypothetical protein
MCELAQRRDLNEPKTPVECKYDVDQKYTYRNASDRFPNATTIESKHGNEIDDYRCNLKYNSQHG